jgi:hypothetical protein
MKRIASALLAMLALYGCASGPQVSELRQGVHSVAFVQHGTEPLKYSFGVVDTSSFWAQNGGNLGAGVGLAGQIAGETAAQVGRDVSAKNAPTAAQIMKALYGNHPMVNETSRTVMPQLAKLWGVPYDARQVRVLQSDTPLMDKEGRMATIVGTPDLVLRFAVADLQLTEKFSVGGAFAAGFTMGTNTKNVAAQTTAVMSAWKRDPATGKYTNVWTQLCSGLAMYSKVAYPFPEVVKSRDKAKELWDANTQLTIESCSKVIEHLAKS